MERKEENRWRGGRKGYLGSILFFDRVRSFFFVVYVGLQLLNVFNLLSDVRFALVQFL